MDIDQLEKRILVYLDELNQLTLKTSRKPSSNEIGLIINHYEKVFLVLFGDGQANRGYIHKINNESDNEMIHFYLSSLSQLTKNIQEFPFQPEIKELLLNQLKHYCDPVLLKKFNKAPLTRSDYQQVMNYIQHNKPVESLVDTVVVKAWGVKQEVSRGLRNVVKQRVQGEGIGHASITMRVKADDKGWELIKKYCLNGDMSEKIPFQLKQYGHEVVYEVYFSFWPDGLSSLDQDILDEHSSVDMQEDVQILQEMPLELKSRYLFEKYKQNPSLFFALPESLRGIENERILKSEFKGYRKMALAPVAIFDTSEIEPDAERRKYLDLKLKQYALSEEITSLLVLQEHYLTNDSLMQSEKIKGASNFLLLLKRFQAELPEQQLIAKILLEHHISSRDEINQLKKDVQQLIANKEIQSNSLNQEIFKEAGLIDEDVSATTVLQSEITKLQDRITANQKSEDYLKTIFSVLMKITTKRHSLTEQEKAAFQQFTEVFDKGFISSSILKLSNGGSITPAQSQTLITEFKKYQHDYLYNPEELAKKQTEILDKRERLRVLYSATKEKKINNAQSALNEVEELISLNTTKILQNNKESQNIAGIFEQLDNTEIKEQPGEHKKITFTFHDMEGNEKTRTILNKNDLIPIIKELNDLQIELATRQSSLVKVKDSCFERLLKIQFNRQSSAEELAQRKIKRGSSNDVVLKGFNIEEMLKVASKLATPGDTKFHLAKENCSTACMKLLETGAPQNQKEFFQWDPSRMLLSNPQAVFSAASVVARGEEYQEQYRDTLNSEKEYHALINQLIGSLSSFNHLNSEDKPTSNSFSWYNYLKFLPHLFQIHKEIIHRIPLEQKEQNNSLPTKIATEIKQLEGNNSYYLIQSSDAFQAIQQMLDALKKDKYTVPFFEKDTLSRVEKLVLTLEVKTRPRVEVEELLLTHFKRIELERNERIQTIEQSLISGTPVKRALAKREPNVTNIRWETLSADYKENASNSTNQYKSKMGDLKKAPEEQKLMNLQKH